MDAVLEEETGKTVKDSVSYAKEFVFYPGKRKSSNIFN